MNTYVVAQEGNRVADLIVSPATEDQEADLVTGLNADVNKKYLWRVADIRLAFPFVKEALVQQLLTDAGYAHRAKNNMKGESIRRAGWAYGTYGTADIPCHSIGNADELKPRLSS